jgi:hypothetical protein
LGERTDDGEPEQIEGQDAACNQTVVSHTRSPKAGESRIKNQELREEQAHLDCGSARSLGSTRLVRRAEDTAVKGRLAIAFLFRDS